MVIEKGPRDDDAVTHLRAYLIIDPIDLCHALPIEPGINRAPLKRVF